MEALGVGIIGCGNIAAIYAKNIARFPELRLAACADLLPERAEAFAGEHGIDQTCSVDRLLTEPGVDVVLNLTIPKAHYDVSRAALASGKHVYGEKPLALDTEQGGALLRLAAERGLRVGCAPDTFLGAAHQTARKVIDDGWIGKPVSATAFMQCHGHESWHPDPAFYYAPGGGPLFDMGPYYLTALVNMMGPIAAISGMAGSAYPERRITSEAKYGERIPVETPTHLTGTAAFASGALCTLIMSFDTWQASLPHIEIHGTEGSMQVPDPNCFGGEVRIWRPGYEEWQPMPPAYGYSDNSRGLGLADMARAISGGRPHRASGELALHAVEVMEGFLKAAERGATVAIGSAPERPVAFPLGAREGEAG